MGTLSWKKLLLHQLRIQNQGMVTTGSFCDARKLYICFFDYWLLCRFYRNAFFLHSSLSLSKLSSAVYLHGTDGIISPSSSIFASVNLSKLQGLFKQTFIILQKYLTSEGAPVDLTSSAFAAISYFSRAAKRELDFFSSFFFLLYEPSVFMPFIQAFFGDLQRSQVLQHHKSFWICPSLSLSDPQLLFFQSV